MKYITILFLLQAVCGFSQPDRWQQKVDYSMEIDFDVDKHQFKGKQKLKYTNNSPDTLNRIFYHLFFNAFQPGSMMDVRSRTIVDPDKRVMDRIFHLKADEIGYQIIDELKQDGQNLKYSAEGTILEVDLAKPLLPGKSTTLEMKFNAQVPVQIRRSGRDNFEGISYSMAQWYPKLCEYDYQGWHAHPYVGREFHGVWGDYKVKIKIDRSYTVAAGGLIKNPEKMGHGYSDKDTKKRKFLQKKKLTWEFEANNVHDFMWAADPDYTHVSKLTDNGILLHYFYQKDDGISENWENLHVAMNEAIKFMNKNYGEYPYPMYAFIQGGDGGMEYAMGTLMEGGREYRKLVGLAIHEWMHSWYQMVLGSNEALYPWMDEGFTSFATAEVMEYLKTKNLVPGRIFDNAHTARIRGFARLAANGEDEAMSTHADHYTNNKAHGIGAYTKGAVFLAQLEYIIGKRDFRSGLLRYYNEWKFKHPNPNDFIRVMEKESGIELDWYKEYWVNTTHTIDYSVDAIELKNGHVQINLKKLGYMPMPLDIQIKLKDGSVKNYNIPLRIMRGEKSGDSFSGTLLADWPWTNTDYAINTTFKLEDIESVTIDPDNRMSDINIYNNTLSRIEPEMGEQE